MHMVQPEQLAIEERILNSQARNLVLDSNRTNVAPKGDICFSNAPLIKCDETSKQLSNQILT